MLRSIVSKLVATELAVELDLGLDRVRLDPRRPLEPAGADHRESSCFEGDLLLALRQDDSLDQDLIAHQRMLVLVELPADDRRRMPDGLDLRALQRHAQLADHAYLRAELQLGTR